MKRILKYVVILFLALLGLVGIVIFDLFGGPTIVQEYISHKQPENLSFSFSGCESSTYPPEAVDNTSWVGDTLNIDVTITPNCGTTWLFGSYKQVGSDELILGYKTIAPSFVGCNCDFKAKYSISGLEKKDYKIKIKEYSFINKVPKSLRMVYGIGDDIVEEGEL